MANQSLNNSRFTKEAAEWDSNTKHVESTQNALEAIQRYVPAFQNGTNKDLNVLEIGSGTGLLSYLLSPHVHSLVGVDTAIGMIDAFDKKLEAHDPKNLVALNHFLVDADSSKLQAACANLHPPSSSQPYRFDLAVSHLTLHHIPSLPAIFTTLYACLKEGGCVALTDYEDFGNEAIRFHPPEKRPGVERHGLQIHEVVDVMGQVGFKGVKVERAYGLKKEVEGEEGFQDLGGKKGGGEMVFPFLMCFGVK